MTDVPDEAREYFVSELVSTERNYIEELRKMKRYYEAGLVSIDKQFKRIFQHLDEIVLINTTLLEHIQLMVDGKCQKDLGEIFITSEPLFKFYKNYCIEYKSCQDLYFMKKTDKRSKDSVSVSVRFV
jgi:hypothetical protein